MFDEPETPGKAGVMGEMMGSEALYLCKYPYKEGKEEVRQELIQRYQDPRSSAEQVDKSVARFAATRGVNLDQVPENLKGLSFGPDSQAQLREGLHGLVDQFFASSTGSQNPLKKDLCNWQGERFLELLGESQQEGSTGPLSASQVYRLMAQNVAVLASQDRASAEVILGDHGVRHLVGHNIKVCETMADKLEGHGVPVSAKDRLILHQSMLLHDLGYAVDHVRDAMQEQGIQGQDGGHPVLAGRYVRERMQNDADPLNAIFSAEDMHKMHRCVMYHDMDAEGKPGIDFTMKSQLSEQEQTANLESITRLADNSHAFDDKLTEVLYRHPSALKTMRMIKTAGEIGDPKAEQALRDNLCLQLDARQDLSDDDKQAMKSAVAFMNPTEFNFSMRRILASKPTFDLDASGKVTVRVQESPIHQGLAELGGQPQHKILGGYIEALTGEEPKINRQTRSVDSPQVRVELGLGDARATTLDPFQQNVATEVLADDGFRNWALQDVGHMKTQQSLQTLLQASDQLSDSELRIQAGLYLEDTDGDLRSALQQRLQQVKQERADELRQQMARG